MATYDFVFNIAKGKAAYYASLPGTNDGLVAIPLDATGIVGAATMKDYDTVAAILAGATNEQTDIPRKPMTTVASTVDDTNDWTDVDADNVVFDGSTPGGDMAAFVVAYDPDTTGGSDADLIPLVIFDLVVTSAGGDITYEFPVGGFYRAT